MSFITPYWGDRSDILNPADTAVTPAGDQGSISGLAPSSPLFQVDMETSEDIKSYLTTAHSLSSTDADASGGSLLGTDGDATAIPVEATEFIHSSPLEQRILPLKKWWLTKN